MRNPGGSTEEKREAGRPYIGPHGEDRPPRTPDPMVPNLGPGLAWPAPGLETWADPAVSPTPARQGPPRWDNSEMTPLYDTPARPSEMTPLRSPP